MYEEQLIKMVNSGNCLALVGAGLSKEIGYPDWHQLAERTFSELKETVRTLDDASYLRYLADRRYPEFFSQAERDFGSRKTLEAVVSRVLDFTPATLGEAYKFICRWPFACYLTTNFDDELQRHLRSLSVEFAVSDNTPSSLATLRVDTRDTVFKLHSDFRLPGRAVLTSADYSELYATGSGTFYRDCLRAVFQRFDLLVVGFSLSDPDMSYILELAKEGASPAHPIYMVAPKDDFTDADAHECRDRYNIRLLRYANPDGSHRELRRTLETYDCFIQPRNTSPLERILSPNDIEDSLDALSLLLYRKLAGDGANQMLAPIVLSELHKAHPSAMSIQQLSNSVLHGALRHACDAEAIIADALSYLCGQSQVDTTDDGYRISRVGKERHEQILFNGRGIKARAFGMFRQALRDCCDPVTGEHEGQACSALETAITTAFSQHSAAIVNAILSDSGAVAHEGIALFQYIRDAASSLPKGAVFGAYMSAASRFIFSPTEDQKQYLGLLAQGFFLAHLLGRDPRLQKIRRETLQEAAWLVDSCVLIPLIARGCRLSEFAESLFSQLESLGGVVVTTKKIVQEVWEHFRWAKKQSTKYSDEELESLYSCVLSDSYRDNLFLEGYASYAGSHGLESFHEYASECFSETPSLLALERRLHESHILVFDPEALVSDGAELEGWKRDIAMTRKGRQTWRSEFQIEAESEAYWVIQNYERIPRPNDTAKVLRAYFVSDSNILNSVAGRRVTWLPEAVSRYLSEITGIELNSSVMQQCVLESISDDFTLVDRRRFVELFGKRIEVAKLDFEREKHRYIEAVEDTNVQEMEDAFAATPDLEKPQFVSQMGWKVARSEQRRREEALCQRKKAIDDLGAAQRRISELEREKEAGWKRKQNEAERQRAARLRNLQDPRHVRKRIRQAKNRRRKKK